MFNFKRKSNYLTELRKRPWHEWSHDDIEIMESRSMITVGEKRVIHYLASRFYKWDGFIVDLGCFVGSDTCMFASGLKNNPVRRPRSFSQKPIHAYDLFYDPLAGGSKISDKSFDTSKSWLDEYYDNIESHKELIETHAGDIFSEKWDVEDEIEILFVDICKSIELNSYVSKTFFKSMMPGRTVLVQQDYHDDHFWIPITMEILKEHFETIDGPIGGSAVFLYTKELDLKTIDQATNPDLISSRQAIKSVQQRYKGWYRRLFMLCEARLLAHHGLNDEATEVVNLVERDYPDHRVLGRRIKRARAIIGRH